MTELGITLVTAAVQVTLVALPAVLVVAIVGRRSPRAAATLAAVALASCLVLTALAFGPAPRWRDCLPFHTETSAATADHGPVLAHDAPSAGGWIVDLQRLTDLFPASGRTTRDEPAWSGWSWFAVAILMGTAIAFLRLVAAVRTVADCRRDSRPVNDPVLIQIVEELRAALSCRREVEVRQSAAVGTAATVGWMRPVILLADDWPTWPAGELRAVLAHELAHVRRRDYPAALLAAGCRALHFYHPLVGWLAARLRLHQELAADALAAPASGGRAPYLVALARMAIRQDRSCLAGAARPFLSDRNSLLRRVAMLRVMDDGRPLSRAAGWVLAGLLVASALGASAVRGTAQAPAAAKADAVATAEVPPFDLTFVPPKADGVVLIRPAALFGRPEMKEVTERWNKSVKVVLQELGLESDLEIALEQVEQVVGPFEVKRYTDEEMKRNPDGKRNAVIMGMFALRMTPGFDWPSKLRALPPAFGIKEVKPDLFECRAAPFGPQTMKLYVLDPRTLVFGIFDSPQPGRAENAARWGGALKAVERSGLAVLLDNRTGRWTDSLAENKEAALFAAVLGKPRHAAFGLNWGERVSVTCAAEWAEPPTDAAVARGSQNLRGLLILALGESPGDPTLHMLYSLAGVLLRDARVKRDGAVVTAESVADFKWADVLKPLAMDEPPAKAKAEVPVEKKEKK